MLFSFSLFAIASHGTLHLALGLVGMHSVAASIWVLTKFSYSSLEVSSRCLLKNIKLVSYSNRLSISNITIGE